MRNYKNYEVWQKAHELCLKLYKEILPMMPVEERYGLSMQLRRSASSIPLNIVEGCGRNSDKDFAHFLDVALGSAHETEYSLLLAKDLGFIPEASYQSISECLNPVKAMLINLIKSIRKDNSAL